MQIIRHMSLTKFIFIFVFIIQLDLFLENILIVIPSGL